MQAARRNAFIILPFGTRGHFSEAVIKTGTLQEGHPTLNTRSCRSSSGSAPHAGKVTAIEATEVRALQRKRSRERMGLNIHLRDRGISYLARAGIGPCDRTELPILT